MLTKVLVIEDDTKVQDTLIDILEFEGFKTISAPNGEIGLMQAKLEKPDLVICDVMMPALDGYAVLAQLRQNEATATIPFIFLTAKADRSDVRQGMICGADDYLTKPFTPTELKQAIFTLLEKHAALKRQYQQEYDRAQQYSHQAQDQQLIAETQEQLLKKLTHELRDPLSNINVAIRLLEHTASPKIRDRYLKVLKDECAREMTLLNQMTQLQDLLTPGNIRLLRQLQILK